MSTTYSIVRDVLEAQNATIVGVTIISFAPSATKMLLGTSTRALTSKAHNITQTQIVRARDVSIHCAVHAIRMRVPI